MESVEVNAKLDYAVFAWESVQYGLFDLYIIDYFIDYLFLICLPLSYIWLILFDGVSVRVC